MKIFRTILMAGLVAVNSVAQDKDYRWTQKDPEPLRMELGNT